MVDFCNIQERVNAILHGKENTLKIDKWMEVLEVLF